jgi:hypothetical protein
MQHVRLSQKVLIACAVALKLVAFRSCALAADSTFRNPAFAAPVTRLEALRSEIFTINAEVGP